MADRVVRAALKLVLEPVFEADFEPCSSVPDEAARLGRHRRDLLLRYPGYRWPGTGDRWALSTME